MKASDQHDIDSDTELRPFPATHCIVAAEALLTEISRVYAIDIPVACKLLNGGRNDTYLLSTRHEHYVVRVYGASWRSVSEVHYELQLLQHLAARGVFVSLPICDKDGNLMHPLTTPEGVRVLVLFTFADGKPLTWAAEQDCRLLGHVVASIHAASDDFVSEHARCRLDLAHLIDAPLTTLRPLLVDRPDDLRFLTILGADLRHRAEAVTRVGMAWGVCHGDVAKRNILVSQNRTWTAIDFDLSGPGWRVCDLVPVKRVATCRIRESTWDAFLEGYQQVKRLSEADLAAVELFYGIRRLWSLGMRAGLVHLQGAATVRAYIDSRVASLREWAVACERVGWQGMQWGESC